jgi:hypothetical protein
MLWERPYLPVRCNGKRVGKSDAICWNLLFVLEPELLFLKVICVGVFPDFI